MVKRAEVGHEDYSDVARALHNYASGKRDAEEFPVEMFQKACVRTWAIADKSHEWQAAVAALGLIGEMVETSEACDVLLGPTRREMLAKEVGDVMYYASTLASIYGLQMGNVLYKATSLLLESELLTMSTFQRYVETDVRYTMARRTYDKTCLIWAGAIAEQVKKQVAHGHVRDDCEMRNKLGHLLFHLAAVALDNNISLDFVMYRNVKKLMARYPDGFESARSINKSEVDE